MAEGQTLVELDQTDDWESGADWVAVAEHAVLAAFTVADFAPAARISISINLSDNDEVQTLNHQWRGKNKPTNVLSFPMLESDDLVRLIQHDVPEVEILLGDIILAHQICAAEAGEKGITLPSHATHLIIHGTLHLLGYDHIDDAEAQAMEAHEVKALASLGLPNPY